jgi:hypothetical protein
MFALGHEDVFVELGTPQLRPVIVTGYGLGFWTVKYTQPAGPPG